MTNKLFNSILILILINISCAPQRIGLSDNEKKIEEKLQLEYNCPDLELRHDYESVTFERENGEFEVLLCDGFCALDTIDLGKFALQMSKVIIPVIEHKMIYSQIVFYTDKEEKIDERRSRLECSKTIRILLSHPNEIYSYSW